MIAKLAGSALAVLVTLPLTHVFAAPIPVVSYDMRNGDGVASSGAFNYWDLEYSGVGIKTVDGAPLTGGKGNLTDGVITTQNWFAIENVAGTGPYVGWNSGNGANPIIKFLFGAPVSIANVIIHMDDSNNADNGGVDPAVSVGISSDGVTFATTLVADPASGDPFSLVLPVGFTSDAVYIQLNHRNAWVFVDEISFDSGTTAVAEPGVLALLSAGVLGFGALRRRRSQTF